ncbi:MAG: carboxypeptidase regulatory-like domain-containing protein [Terriglobales bacterium]
MRSTKLWIRSCGFGFACLLLVVLGLLSAARAQGVGASAGIKGAVTDSSGGVMPRANVVAENAEKGIRRTAVTDNSGEYRFTGLPPATYNVTVELPGFQTEIQRGLAITVGQTAVLDFHLKVASRKETVEVSAEPPAVDTERSGQADTLTQTYIDDLPIDRRDYLTFTLLAPGVSNSTRLADDTSYRVKQTPTSGLSFYGSNGRGNSVTVDGGEANDDEGGVRLTLSQDAVQEFQINRSNYTAELGGASGATINIVSRSGTDNVHGSLYGFFRNDAMDARDPFAFSSALAPDPTYSNFNTTSTGEPIKNSLSRQQYGGAIGFPIVKDRTFLYGSFEGLRQNSQNSVPLLTDSSIFAGPSIAGNTLPAYISSSDARVAQQAVIQQLWASESGNVTCFAAQGPVSPQLCAGELQAGLAVAPNSGLSAYQGGLNDFLISQFENNGGVFPYNTRQYLGSGRLDHRFSTSDQTFLRYNYGHDLEESPDVQSLTAYSRGSSIQAYNHTLLGAWFHLFSPTTQNEARVQWSYNHTNVIPNEAAEVGLDLPGFGQFGTNIFLPQHEILRHYEFADNLSLTRGHHTLRFGGTELIRGNHTETAIFLPGRFEFGPLPGGLLSPCLAPSNPLCPGVTTPGTALNSLQNASLGLPIFLQDGFGNAAYGRTRPFTSLYAQDAWAIASNFTLNYGIRYELDTQYAPLNTPKHNFAPRVSFAWDPFKDHKTVIRAGYGIFYSQIYDVVPGVDWALGVLNKNNTGVENYGVSGPGSQMTNLATTCGLYFPAGGVDVPGNGSSPCTRKIGIYVDPITVNSPAVFENLFLGGQIGCTTPLPGNYACITPGDLQAASSGVINPTNSGQIPGLSVLFTNQPNYKSAYSQQAEFGIEREVAAGFSVSLSYIYSHTVHLPVAIDTNVQDPGFVSLTLANGGTARYRDWNTSTATDPADLVNPTITTPCETNPGACFYNPLLIQNNQYTSAGSALYQGGILEVKKQFNKGMALMGSYTYSKAFDTTTDYNSDYGPQDNLNLAGEHSLSNFDQRNKVVIAGIFGSPWEKGILSGFEVAPIFNYNSGHPFNLLSGEATNGDNHPTNGRPIGAARNTGLGPNYVDFDMRLSWHHKVGEKTTLLLTAEGFNIANRTNYASVNNEVDPLFGFNPTFTTFNVQGIRPNGTTVTPSTPLSFTSDFPKRQIQLGLRLTF